LKGLKLHFKVIKFSKPEEKNSPKNQVDGGGISSHTCHMKPCIEVLNVNIFRFKMQKYPIWADDQAEKSRLHRRKKPKIDLGNYRVCPNSGN
jgi:hypothetical protein